MLEMEEQNKLKEYSDKTYINSVLAQYHYDCYYRLNLIAMLPLILGSSLLTILNSAEIRDDILKIINISINATNAIIMSLLNAYKIVERINCYKSLYNKYQTLNHKIEKGSIDIDTIINDYDIIQNDNPYGWLSYYKKRIIKVFGGKKTLPNSLALDYEISVDLV